MGLADDEEGPMVYVNKEAIDRANEQARRKFQANPAKYVRRYRVLLGAVHSFLCSSSSWRADRPSACFPRTSLQKPRKGLFLFADVGWKGAPWPRPP